MLRLFFLVKLGSLLFDNVKFSYFCRDFADFLVKFLVSVMFLQIWLSLGSGC